MVFPEYLPGRVTIPGPQTGRIAGAAAEIYVVVGRRKVFEDEKYANTAILFDRSGKIAGKYGKVHAAVDHAEGQPPWSKPPQGKDDERFPTNDPEWKMVRGRHFPVFDLDFGRVGVLTCYDGRLPETHRILSLWGGPRSWSGSTIGRGLHRQIGDVPGRGGDGRHEPGVRGGDDDRPVARPDPRRLHGAEGGLRHR